MRKEDIPKNISKDILASLLDTYFKNMHKNMNSFAFPMSDDEIRKLKEKQTDAVAVFVEHKEEKKLLHFIIRTK